MPETSTPVLIGSHLKRTRRLLRAWTLPLPAFLFFCLPAASLLPESGAVPLSPLASPHASFWEPWSMVSAARIPHPTP
ncbi:uncharacterized protein CC84DRAFT_393275 [Paraphaeosphaeria sporulosa]|uniref:Uncharacterized protein n=1 Tax=Paraphaeosphaeria sporulosa TaxID=1460663 RepID=A0A177BVI4_9PLEO|nr:uncharacterized protein CC84DRAFT_393275 [Paraphaeosphaeria sporulosa]OAF99324.1 hypothetical protein CC84DRAFT_393275 [Paraphaeosphaeria sporulosa]